MLPGRDREDLWLCESLHRRASLALKGLEEGNGKKEDMYKILSRVDYSDDVFMQVIEAPAVAAACQPGQFIILMIHEEGERIPLTIADFDREAGTITIVVQAIGTSTRHLQTLGKGDSLSNFIGPLGMPSEIEKVGTVVLAGGGVGVAPIYPIARALKEAGNKIISIVAARNQSLLVWEDKMREISDDELVTDLPHLVLPDQQALVAGGDDGDDLVAGLLERPRDGIDRRHTDAAAGQDDRAHLFDLARHAQRTDEVAE